MRRDRSLNCKLMVLVRDNDERRCLLSMPGNKPLSTGVGRIFDVDFQILTYDVVCDGAACLQKAVPTVKVPAPIVLTQGRNPICPSREDRLHILRVKLPIDRPKGFDKHICTWLHDNAPQMISIPF